MKWINKLERKYRRYAISNLMTYIIALNAAVYVINLLIPQSNLYAKLALNPAMILRGEIWRLITFLFLPPSSSPIFIVFVLYFYYLVGSNLEYQWGSFRFNIYYLIGVLSTIAASFISYAITGFGLVSPEHLNLSLFLAFAHLFPILKYCFSFSFPSRLNIWHGSTGLL